MKNKMTINTYPVGCQDIYEMNLQLLEMLRQEHWDEFIIRARDYAALLSEFIANPPDNLTLAGWGNLTTLAEKLRENDTEITERLKLRLRILSDEMSKLNLGKKGSNSYSAQMFINA